MTALLHYTEHDLTTPEGRALLGAMETRALHFAEGADTTDPDTGRPVSIVFLDTDKVPGYDWVWSLTPLDAKRATVKAEMRALVNGQNEAESRYYLVLTLAFHSGAWRREVVIAFDLLDACCDRRAVEALASTGVLGLSSAGESRKEDFLVMQIDIPPALRADLADAMLTLRPILVELDIRGARAGAPRGGPGGRAGRAARIAAAVEEAMRAIDRAGRAQRETGRGANPSPRGPFGHYLN